MKGEEWFFLFLFVLVIAIMLSKIFGGVNVEPQYNVVEDENVQKIYEYGEEIMKKDLQPNTIIAKLNGEEVLFHEVERYKNAMNNNGEANLANKGALYQVLENKIYVYMAKRFPSVVEYDLDIENNIEKVKNEWINGDKDYKIKLLDSLCIGENEIWLNENDFITYMQNISVEQMLIQKGKLVVNKLMMEKPELVNDQTLNEKVKNYNAKKSEQDKYQEMKAAEGGSSVNEADTAINEIRDIFVKDLIQQSNLELCADKGELSTKVPEIYKGQ